MKFLLPFLIFYSFIKLVFHWKSSNIQPEWAQRVVTLVIHKMNEPISIIVWRFIGLRKGSFCKGYVSNTSPMVRRLTSKYCAYS